MNETEYYKILELPKDRVFVRVPRRDTVELLSFLLNQPFCLQPSRVTFGVSNKTDDAVDLVHLPNGADARLKEQVQRAIDDWRELFS
jgi:hypothetical protein